MPAIKIIGVKGTDIKLGLWRIDESVDGFLNSNYNLRAVYNLISKHHSDVRKCEKLAIYSLLFMMTGDTSLVIHYDNDGKPLVRGFSVSISHTKQYAVLAISRTRNVAVDIEYFSDRVSKITGRFMRDDEDSSTVEKQLITWSAKETAYKLFPEQHLQYFDMRLREFEVKPSGIILLYNLKCALNINIDYHLNKSYVLTYSYL